MQIFKGVAIIAGVLIPGKLILTFIPGEYTGKDFASLIWMLLVVGCYFLAGYALRVIRPIKRKDISPILFMSIGMALAAGFLIHSWATNADFSFEIIGTLFGALLIRLITSFLLLDRDESQIGIWFVGQEKSIPVFWKPASGQIIGRDGETELPLGQTALLDEAALRMIVFALYRLPDSALKVRIDQAFTDPPYRILKPNMPRWHLIMMGLAACCAVSMLILWLPLGVSGIVPGLLLYMIIWAHTVRWVTRYNTTALASRHLKMYTAAITKYERSYEFFTTSNAPQRLYPFTF